MYYTKIYFKKTRGHPVANIQPLMINKTDILVSHRLHRMCWKKSKFETKSPSGN